MADIAHPAIDVTSPRSPTAELHRLRRNAIVDGGWFLGFVVAFTLAGTQAIRALWVGLLFGSPAEAMLIFIGALLAAGVAGGILGAGLGYLVAYAWKRVDLRRNPRRYEPLAQ